MLLDKFNSDDYSNPKVAALIKAILDLEPDFVNRSQGNVMNSMLITTGSCFGVSANISTLYGAVPQKITKPVTFKDPHPRKKFTDPHCATCGKSATVGVEPEQSSDSQDIMESLKNENIKSSREVLNMFSGDLAMLRLAAKDLSIPVHKDDKAATIAKRIFEYYERNLVS